MILGFKPQFKEPILNGKKIHTIRVDRGNRWKAGRKIQMATGVRTKQFECFKETECVRIQEFSFWRLEEPCGQEIYGLLVDKKLLNMDKIKMLIKNDGFTSTREFIDFFKDKMPFTGKIIHWTDFKY